MKSEDIIQYVLAQVKQQVPEFTEEMSVRIECEVRKVWGGEHVTIAKRGPVLERIKAQVQREYGSKTIAELQRDTNGLSRATLYRWIKEADKK